MSSFSISANFSNTAGMLLCFLISKLVFVFFLKRNKTKALLRRKQGHVNQGKRIKRHTLLAGN